MPVNVADFIRVSNVVILAFMENRDPPVKEPRTWIVGDKPNCSIVTGQTNRHDVATNRILVVVNSAPSTSYDNEIMLWTM